MWFHTHYAYFWGFQGSLGSPEAFEMHIRKMVDQPQETSVDGSLADSILRVTLQSAGLVMLALISSSRPSTDPLTAQELEIYQETEPSTTASSPSPLHPFEGQQLQVLDPNFDPGT